MHPPIPRKPDGDATWRTRLASLRNIRPLLGMVWDTSPALVSITTALRLVRALLPLAMLWVSMLILNGVVAWIKRGNVDSAGLWKLVALELGLAVLSDLLARANSLVDSLLGDRFTNRISVRLIEHATQLDLASFEDPVFYDKLERARRQTTGRIGLLAAVLNVAQDTLSLISLSASLIVFSPWLLILLVAAAFSRSRMYIEKILQSFTDISDQALYLKDLFEFFEMKPAIRSLPNALPAPRPIRSGFEFKNVAFAYPGSDRMVVENISFHLETQEKIALIGENGAGKTTLVKLLARLYDPTAGQILLDGVDLREYDVEDLRKEIGVIFQDYMRYELLVKENIGFGKIEDLADRSRIEMAAQKSMAFQVIGKLPNGYDQMIGRRFDGGVDLSGGEWQKFALARAYMRDAQLLIFDEPTATLDARAEYEVFRRFAELTKGRMAVLISHRFSTVRMADRILVLQNGRIFEQGTRAHLVALGGQYAELFELQAAGYR